MTHRTPAGTGWPDVTVQVDDADNHLFFPGSGPSAPAGYEPAQHLDPGVVVDIAGWPARPGPARTADLVVACP